MTKALEAKAEKFFSPNIGKKIPLIADIGDEYNKDLLNGGIAKTMRALFKLDKHHLFTSFKMGYYCAVLLGRTKCRKK